MTIISYAANHEDVMLWRALRQQQAGFYVDIGAADPDASVTKLFYDAGWSGINIEPVPHFAAHLRVSRPRSVVIEAAAGAAAGRMMLHVVADRDLCLPHPCSGAPARTSNHLGEPLEVEVRTLSEILHRHAPPHIHFLRIGTGGAEKAVLEGADLRAHRPWIILAEATRRPSQPPSHDQWEPLLVAADYGFVWFDGQNRFYVAAERMADLQPAFAAPPNVFDDFVSFAESDLRSRLAATEAAARNQARHGEARAAEARKRAAELAMKLTEERISSAELARQLKQAKRHTKKIKRSISWRVAGPVRAGERVFKRCLSVSESWLRPRRHTRLAAVEADLGHRKRSVPTLDHRERERQNPAAHRARHVAATAPSLAFLLEDHGADAGALERTLASLVAQTDGNWACLVAAAAPAKVADRSHPLPSARGGTAGLFAQRAGLRYPCCLRRRSRSRGIRWRPQRSPSRAPRSRPYRNPAWSTRTRT